MAADGVSEAIGAGLFGFRVMLGAAILAEPRGTMILLRRAKRDKGWHWILRRQGRSGKGGWIGRLVVLLLVLLAFWLLLIFLGRPIEPRIVEVDVTDKIAESASR